MRSDWQKNFTDKRICNRNGIVCFINLVVSNESDGNGLRIWMYDGSVEALREWD
ncbi:hypothetical protein LYSBPC_13560 [Lysinibacillus piscis]|uniref:Uncharacterized protein n=1 Tax=Lysinibacillus piscis TaxID=2518931 RepID=A0ABQ5NIV9_9BACI|nr:hypothetical protein LYSBPC_13560 [Lysinibacillus sp. KH24]